MDEAGRPIAYVALTSAAAIRNDTLCRVVTTWMARRGNRVCVRLLGGAAEGRGGMILSVGPVALPIMCIDAPVPGHLFVADAGQDAVWPDWRAMATSHRAHLVALPLIDDPKPLQASAGAGAETAAERVRAAALVTFETACGLAALDEAVGVYWAPGRLFVPASALAEAHAPRRRTRAEMLVRLSWFGAAAPGGAGVGARTHGLMPFAGRELLHAPTGETEAVLRGRMIDLSDYLIEHGPVIADGHEVRRRGASSLRAGFALGPGGQDLLRLDLPDPACPLPARSVVAWSAGHAA